MKPNWRDYATILMAFAAVFLCGYGIGHLVGERKAPPHSSSNSETTPAWEQEILQNLRQSLDLRPAQAAQVEQELSLTARQISQSHDAVLLDYLRHIDQLYGRLIDLLDEEQARRLREEKKTLEKKIEILSNSRP